jgi:hypothetical protein
MMVKNSAADNSFSQIRRDRPRLIGGEALSGRTLPGPML